MATDDDYTPNYDSTLFNGQKPDGTWRALVAIDLTVDDVVGLRAKHLMDPHGEVNSDFGSNAAVARAILEALVKREPLSNYGLHPTNTNVIVGGTAANGPLA